MTPHRVPNPALLPPRPDDGNKGTFGRLLIVGGNHEMIGAPVLAGTAALRTGAGLVQIALPQSVLPAALSITPEVIGLALHDDPAKDDQRLLDAAHKADALVIGPGLGTADHARDRLLALLALDKPMVLDADALNLLAAMKQWPADRIRARAVLTPHPGEMRRLTALLPPDQAGDWPNPKLPIPSEDAFRIHIATLAAQTFAQVVLLKGQRTVITDARRLYLNPTGDSTLAKAGTGDILSGVLGCLLAQHMDPFDAATLAAWLHGTAGELAGAAHGRRSALGRDVIAHLAAAIHQRESMH